MNIVSNRFHDRGDDQRKKAIGRLFFEMVVVWLKEKITFKLKEGKRIELIVFNGMHGKELTGDCFDAFKCGFRLFWMGFANQLDSWAPPGKGKGLVETFLDFEI